MDCARDRGEAGLGMFGKDKIASTIHPSLQRSGVKITRSEGEKRRERK